MQQPTTADTTGFYQASKGLRLFRLALSGAERLWPALAVRAASRLFGTPLPPKWMQRGGHWDAAWHIAHWPFEQANVTVYTLPVAPHGPIALLVHGWGGHAAQLRPRRKCWRSKACGR